MFIRHGLAKQDREKHFGAKIFVPTYKEKVCLDPRRCLLSYLNKTKHFRDSLPKEQRGNLFLALKEPHKAVTTQTISHWIVQVIKDAYAKNEVLKYVLIRPELLVLLGLYSKVHLFMKF